jgi:hypothetical protein
MGRRGALAGTLACAVSATAALGPVAGSEGRTRVLRPYDAGRPGFVAYRLERAHAAKIVRAVLVRGAWRKRLSVARMRRAARRGSLVVSSRAGVRQRLRMVTDLRRPRTRLRSGPRGAVDTGEATFRFGADERAASFECRLDGSAWAGCASPVAYTGLGEGAHRFAVRARDAVDNRDRTAARRRWRVEQSGAPADGDRPVDATPATSEEGDPERPAEPGSPLPGESAPVSVVPPTLPDTTIVSGGPLLSDAFTGPDGVITNHYAYWSQDPTAFRSPTWEMESGCALRSGATLWTGVPTSNIPNRDCSNGSGSEVFRLWTKRADFGDVQVGFRLRNNGFSAGSAVNAARSWDGVKVYLRRQSGTSFYVAEVNRRQGNVIIQKKCPQDGGTYFLLEQVRLEATPAQVGAWEPVGGTVRNLPGGGVRVEVVRQGVPVLTAVDTGTGCAPIADPGRVGIRGDNTDFNVDDFEVSPQA